MAGLLDYLSNLKFEPDAKSMGLMNMGANMLQASNNSPTPVSFGNALGAGLNGFTGGYQAQQNLDDTAAAAEQKKLLDAATINKDNALAGYYNTGGSGQNADGVRASTAGLYRWNKEKNAPEFIMDPENGKRLLPSGSDISLELLKEGLKAQPTTDSYGHPIVRSNSQLNPNFYGSPPPLDDGRNDPAYQNYLRSIRP
jgi:hypothetical protein